MRAFTVVLKLILNHRSLAMAFCDNCVRNFEKINTVGVNEENETVEHSSIY